ncbi:MAG: hypothetical protein D6729_11095 [Deltaproteobacteria bacterium]|nr:MAG: hypothetical protein D6729_11095 [Deltaproteobacteria bacterium]
MSRVVSTTVRVAEAPTVAEVRSLHDFRTRRHASLLEEARDLMVSGREEDALKSVFEALRLERDSYEALALAGTLLSMLGDPEAAALYLREAIRISPERADAYYDLASSLLDLGRAAEALPWLESGTRLLGEREDDLVDFMYSARVEALVELGRYDEAEAVLEEARRRSDDGLLLLAGAADLLATRRGQPRLRLL